MFCCGPEESFLRNCRDRFSRLNVCPLSTKGASVRASTDTRSVSEWRVLMCRRRYGNAWSLEHSGHRHRSPFGIDGIFCREPKSITQRKPRCFAQGGVARTGVV